MKLQALDLRKQAPRSPRVRLGGYVLLPRILDKCRATLEGMQGEYKFDCPQDRRWLSFVDISAAALKKQVAQGKGDGAMLQWVEKSAAHKRSPSEILAWSAWMEQRSPGDSESRDYFSKLHNQAAPDREDIQTWFDLLDLDDYVTFGGKP